MWMQPAVATAKRCAAPSPTPLLLRARTPLSRRCCHRCVMHTLHRVAVMVLHAARHLKAPPRPQLAVISPSILAYGPCDSPTHSSTSSTTRGFPTTSAWCAHARTQVDGTPLAQQNLGVLVLRLAMAALTVPELSPMLWPPQMLLCMSPCYLLLGWPASYARHRLPLLLAHMLLLCLWMVHVVTPAVLQRTPVHALVGPLARCRLSGVDIMVVNALLQVHNETC